jgi:hypothetical protein
MCRVERLVEARQGQTRGGHLRRTSAQLQLRSAQVRIRGEYGLQGRFSSIGL